jgi:hypothetical protein
MDTTTEPRRGPSAGADVPAAPAAESRRRIGEIFVELGFITSAQLEAALDVQRQTGARIGEILVEQGALTRLDLASALAEHWEPRRIEPDEPAGLSLSGLGDDLREQPSRPDGDHAAVAELEQRVRAAEQRLESEHAGAREPRRVFGLRKRSDAEGALQVRLDTIDERLAALQPLHAQVEELRRSLDEQAAVRTAEALAVGQRMRGAEDALAVLGGIEPRLQELLARDLAGRLGELEARLERVEARTDRTAAGAPEARLAGLPERVDREDDDGHGRAFDLADELRLEAASAAAEVRQSLSSQGEEMTALRAEAASLAARIDEIQALRAAEARVARAADERLGAAVEELTRRLEEQAALAEEQVRATEHAVRKGLASLGKRLVGQDGVDARPGKGLRRSIDRLGAAIVEADARQAGQIPATDVEGYVAFVPTADGYRLVAIPDSPPELGEKVEVPDSGGGFVVTRYGRSPLPFDARPCAYLERD